MKNIFLIVSLMTIFVSCGQARIERTISAYMSQFTTNLDETTGDRNEYQPVETNVIKELNAAGIKDFFINKYAKDGGMTFLKEETSKPEFIENRNREFKDFRTYTKDYEKRVMKGDLKDKSEFCTQLRQVTEIADSLLQVWDTVDNLNPDYIYVMSWWLNRKNTWYNEECSEELIAFSSDRDIAKQFTEALNSIPTDKGEDIIAYVVSHIGLISNSFEDAKMKIKFEFILDKEYNILYADPVDYREVK